MTDQEIIQIAIAEIQNKSWGVTQQFLEIHDVILTDGVAKMDRIDREKADGTAIVYFPVNVQKFHIAVSIQSKTAPMIVGVGAEPCTDIFFQCSSETLSFEELAGLTTLAPTDGWRKGETRNSAKSANRNSVIRFAPNPGPDEFANKLRNLLEFLEQDPVGVKKLADLASGHIQAIITFHNGNSMLGGPHIDKESIQRMAALNLAIDFDLYAECKFWTMLTHLSVLCSPTVLVC